MKISLIVILALMVCGCSFWKTYRMQPPMEPLVPEPISYCYKQDYHDVEYTCEDPEECERVQFKCEEGENPFFDDCGCGCMKNER